MSEPLSLPEAEASAEELQRMTLLEHLEELRKRILRSVVILFVGFLACWSFHDRLFEMLSAPILDNPNINVEKLAYTTVTAPFMLYMKISLLAAVFLTSPLLLREVWGFIAPGLYRKEKLYAIPFILFGSFFFMAGGVFAYVVAFPAAVDFLVGMASDKMEPVIEINRYLSFLMTILLGLGVMFELPIFIFTLSQLGLVTPRFLLRNFRWAVIIIFVVAAVLTPTPDPINLCIFALPTVALYFVGVGAAALAQRAKRRREAAD